MGTWFRQIVNEVLGDNEVTTEDPHYPIKHYASAFKPGDILVFRNAQGNCAGKITRIEGDGENRILFYQRLGLNKWGKPFGESWLNSNSPNVYACRSWLPVLKHYHDNFNPGGKSLSLPNNGKVAYETSNDLVVTGQGKTINVPNGVECIVLKDPGSNKSYYYKYDDASYLGVLDVSDMMKEKSKYLGKNGDSTPILANIDQVTKLPGVYFPLAEEWVLPNIKNIKKNCAWNIDEAEWIGAMCPWLQHMDAFWAKPDGSFKGVLNPFEKNNFNIPPVRAFQVPQEFQHLFSKKG